MDEIGNIRKNILKCDNLRTSTVVDYVKRCAHLLDASLTRIDDGACQLLVELLLRLSRSHDTSSEAVQGCLQAIVPSLTSSTRRCLSTPVLKCILVILHRFSRFCPPFERSLGTTVYRSFSSDGPYSIDLLSRCISLLPLACPSGEKGKRRAEAWSKLMTEAIHGAHESFVEFIGLASISHQEDCCFVASEGPDCSGSFALNLAPKVSSQLVVRVECLLKIVKLMLRTSIAAPVSIPLKQITSLILCIIAHFRYKQVSKPLPVEYLKLYATVVGAGLNLTGELTKTLRLSVCPHVKEVIRAAVRCIRQLEVCESVDGFQSTCHYLMIIIYDTIAAAAMFCGPSSGLPGFSDQLSLRVLKDLSPLEGSITGHRRDSVEDAVVPEKRRKIGIDSAMTVAEDNVSLGIRNEESIMKSRLISACGEALVTILRTMSPRMSCDFYKKIQAFVLQQILSVQGGATCYPYSNDERTEVILYEILGALLSSPHPKCPPAVHPALRIFNAGLNRGSAAAKICAQQLAVCGIMVRPVVFPREELAPGPVSEVLVPSEDVVVTGDQIPEVPINARVCDEQATLDLVEDAHVELSSEHPSTSGLDPQFPRDTERTDASPVARIVRIGSEEEFSDSEEEEEDIFSEGDSDASVGRVSPNVASVDSEESEVCESPVEHKRAPGRKTRQAPGSDDDIEFVDMESQQSDDIEMVPVESPTKSLVDASKKSSDAASSKTEALIGKTGKVLNGVVLDSADGAEGEDVAKGKDTTVDEAKRRGVTKATESCKAQDDDKLPSVAEMMDDFVPV